MAVVARLLLGRERRLAHRLERLAGLVGVVGQAVAQHLLGDLAVTIEPVRLVDRAFVILQAQPLHRIQDRLHVLVGGALAVGVLDAQDELAAALARLQVAVQRGARPADVQEASGTGGEAGAAGHRAGLGVGKPGILPAAAAAGPIRPQRVGKRVTSP